MLARILRTGKSILFPAWLVLVAPAHAADESLWLWRERSEIAGKPVDAFLWTDPAGEAPRALMLVVRNFAELEFCADPVIRAALAKNRIALALVSPNAFGSHDPPEPAWEKTVEILESLEKTSGLPGLAALPLIPFGHSAAGPWARNLTWHHPERLAGMIHYNSGQFVPPA
ncbi:MAG: hypothetical protein H7X97_03640, partial [Opitutaceae bacterium]|nr:hypothetical protein [Verrucomicrobiales bacterium]